MKKNGLGSAITVSEPFHIARARLVARSLGIDSSYTTATTSLCWGKWKYLSRYILKEPLAILQYIVTRKIHVTAF